MCVDVMPAHIFLLGSRRMQGIMICRLMLNLHGGMTTAGTAGSHAAQTTQLSNHASTFLGNLGADMDLYDEATNSWSPTRFVRVSEAGDDVQAAAARVHAGGISATGQPAARWDERSSKGRPLVPC